MSFFDKLKQALMDSGGKGSKEVVDAHAPPPTTPTVVVAKTPESQDSQKLKKEKQQRSKKMKKFVHMVNKDNQKASDKSASSKRRATGSEDKKTPNKFVESIKSIKAFRKKKKSKVDTNDPSGKQKLSHKARESKPRHRADPSDPNLTQKVSRVKKKKSADSKESQLMLKKGVSHSEKLSKMQLKKKSANEAEMVGEKVRETPPKQSKSSRSRTKSIYVAPEMRVVNKDDYFTSDLYKDMLFALKQKEPDSEEQSTKFEILTVAARPAISNNRKKRQTSPAPGITTTSVEPLEPLPMMKGKASAEVVDDDLISIPTASLPVTVMPSTTTTTNSDTSKKRSDRSFKGVEVSKKTSVSKIITVKEQRKSEPSVKVVMPKKEKSSKLLVKKTISAPVVEQGKIKAIPKKITVATSAVLNADAQSCTSPDATSGNTAHSNTNTSRSNAENDVDKSEKSEHEGDMQSDKDEKSKRELEDRKANSGSEEIVDGTQDDGELKKSPSLMKTGNK